MSNIMLFVFAGGALVLGAVLGVFIQRNVTSKRIGEANDLARRIVDEARKEAQAQKKEILLQGQNEVFSQKHALEAEYKEQERVLKNREKKLQDITDRMEEKMERITQKEQDILHQEKEQTQRERVLAEKENLLEAKLDEQERRLQEVSGLTSEEAKARLFEEIESRTRHEAAKMMRVIETEAKETADRKAKEILAFELTQMIHGTEEAEKAQAAARAIFGAGASDADMPSTALSADDLTDGVIGILDLMVAGKLAPSRSEAKRLVIQGGVAMNEEKVAAFNATVAEELLKEGVVIRKGKKVYHKFILK